MVTCFELYSLLRPENVTILHSGTTQKYSDNFDSIFATKKSRTKSGKAATKKKAATAKKKKTKKS